MNKIINKIKIKRKYKIILILILLLFWYFSSKKIIKPKKQIPKSLIKLNKQIVQNIKQDTFFKNDYRINRLSKKNNLSNLEKIILKTSKELKIRRIIINKEEISIFYNFNYLYCFPQWYYLYSLSDYTEERKVNSIDKAMIELDLHEDDYFFCEALNKEHWFRCVSRH